MVNGKWIENSKEFVLAYGIDSNLFKYQASTNIINVNKVACDCEDKRLACKISAWVKDSTVNLGKVKNICLTEIKR